MIFYWAWLCCMQIRAMAGNLMDDLPITLEDVKAAADALKDFVHRTPVMTCSQLDKMAGMKLFFKCENLQKTGSFKACALCILKLSHTQAHPYYSVRIWHLLRCTAKRK